MARVRCKIAGHKVKRRGEATVEWYKDGVPQYYCYGYIDRMTGDLFLNVKNAEIMLEKLRMI